MTVHTGTNPTTLTQLTADTLRAQQARRDFHNDHQRRRDHGLRHRHAQKLRRADERLRQAQQDGVHDSWWEDP